MGLYPIDCVSCGKPFLWFSGTQDQRCGECVEKSNALPMRRVFRLDVGGEVQIQFNEIKKGDKFRLEPAEGMDDPYIDPSEVGVACGDAYQDNNGTWTVKSEGPLG